MKTWITENWRKIILAACTGSMAASLIGLIQLSVLSNSVWVVGGIGSAILGVIIYVAVANEAFLKRIGILALIMGGLAIASGVVGGVFGFVWSIISPNSQNSIVIATGFCFSIASWIVIGIGCFDYLKRSQNWWISEIEEKEYFVLSGTLGATAASWTLWFLSTGSLTYPFLGACLGAILFVVARAGIDVIPRMKQRLENLLQKNVVVNVFPPTISPLRAEEIPLSREFRFAHEPIHRENAFRFVGRDKELDSLVERILFSNGGSFLVTGYRGVGKTSFVNQAITRMQQVLPSTADVVGKTEIIDIQLNIARPLQPAELMHHIIRRLYDRLVEKGIYSHLSMELKEELTLAYQRTSVNMTRKLANSAEKSFGLGEVGLGSDLLKATIKTSLMYKSNRAQNYEFSFLGYDDKSAEHDIIRLSHRLADGYYKPETLLGRFGRFIHRRPQAMTRLKIIFIFDEMDKLEEFNFADDMEHRPVIDEMLNALKNLFTTSGICFIFVAGKDLQERWLDDLGRGDSVYESVFSHDTYLQCMWTEVDEICDKLVRNSGEIISTAPPNYGTFNDFKRYLDYKGRGIPRRIIRGFNEYVHWNGNQPVLAFSYQDLRRIRFYAALQNTLAANERRLFGEISEEILGTQKDKRQLGVYYLLDWILRQGNVEFTEKDAISASRQLSKKIALAETIAPRITADVIKILVENEYLMKVEKSLDQVQIGDIEATNEVKFKLTARRQAELSGIASVFEEEGRVFSKEKILETKLGHYDLVEQIGGGGMGTVYRAWDEEQNRVVALKVLGMHLMSDPQAVLRFQREAQVMMAFSHPNIVRIYEFNEAQGQYYIAMEFVEGLDLSAVLRTVGNLTLGDALSVALPLAEALQYVHERGFIRNDIKPANILIDISGVVHITDFGISKSMFDAEQIIQTNPGVFIGTPNYMSPEQAEGAKTDIRTDIYAFGIVLYEMLTGKLPFSGDSPMKVIYAHIHETPTPPSKYVAAIPSSVENVILKCLEKNPEARYQTVSELINALTQLNNGNSFSSPSNLSSIVSVAATRAREKEEKSSSSTHRLDIQRPQMQMEYPAFESPVIAGPPPTAWVPPPLPIVPTPDAISASTGSYALGHGAHLEVLAGISDSEKIFPLDKNKISIGRTEDNDVVLGDATVSRFHAMLVSNELGFSIEDLNSANGTFVNGNPIRNRTVLTNGDSVKIGDVLLRFNVAR